MSSVEDLVDRRAKYRRLHEEGCFVLPNAWDVGSACYLEHLGFAAVATTSGGFAFSRGLPDAQGAISLEATLAHVADMVEATGLPVNVDFESGYAHDPEAVAANVGRCIEAGAAGLSIEDRTGDAAAPLYEQSLAVARIEAARIAIDTSGADVVLTARAETYSAGVAEALDEAIQRLQAYAEAGADVLFAPGPRDRDAIAAIVSAVAPKPLNVLIGMDVGLDVADLAQLGVRRVSVGSALARAAWGGFDRAARTLRDGSFAGLRDGLPFAQLNELFSERRRTRFS